MMLSKSELKALLFSVTFTINNMPIEDRDYKEKFLELMELKRVIERELER